MQPGLGQSPVALDGGRGDAQRVGDLLDLQAAEDERGARQADAVLTTVRSMMVWHQSRDENYVSPIVKGMKRDKRLPEHPGYYGEMVWIVMMLEQWMRSHAPGFAISR